MWYHIECMIPHITAYGNTLSLNIRKNELFPKCIRYSFAVMSNLELVSTFK